MKAPQIMSEFREKGFRMTNIRRKLIELFEKTKMPLSIRDLLRSLEEQGIKANKTTIYREIYFLMGQDVITEIEFGDRKKRYESAHVGHHHHLVCLKCSRVQDVTVRSELKKEEQRIAEQNNFYITSHALEFFGFCKQCKV